MESIILVIVTGAMCIWSFMFGAKVGQAVRKGEEITLPNPIEAAKEHKAWFFLQQQVQQKSA